MAMHTRSLTENVDHRIELLPKLLSFLISDGPMLFQGCEVLNSLTMHPPIDNVFFF